MRGKDRLAEQRLDWSDRGLVRVRFRVHQDDIESETLWAEELGGRRFRLRNTPLFVDGVSFGDTIETTIDRDGMPEFERVVVRGGHSTYRIALRSDAAAAGVKEFVRRLTDLGATIESLTPRFFAVDIPPAAEISAVYRVLELGMEAEVWWFDEMHVGHDLPRAN